MTAGGVWEMRFRETVEMFGFQCSVFRKSQHVTDAQAVSRIAAAGIDRDWYLMG